MMVQKTNILKQLSIVCVLLVVVHTYLSVHRLYASGVSATFADITLENLQIGESYNLRKLKNVPYIIQNTGSEPVDAKIDVATPRKDELKPGYEPIPDTSWITVVPNKFRLGAKEKGFSDIIITIPNDEKILGRHFQAQFLSSGIGIGPPAQFTVAVGTKTRIRMSVGSMGPESLKNEKKRKVMYSLDFEFDSVNIYAKDKVELGKKINLKKEKNVKLNLVNKAVNSVGIALKAVLYDSNVYGQIEGYEAGNPEFLKIKPEKLKLKGETIEKLKLYLEIPNDKKYRDKKFVFLIQAEVIDSIVPVEYFSKLYVTTEK